MKTERSVSDILYIVLVLALCALIVAVFALTFLGSEERSFFYPVLLLFALLLNILLAAHFLTKGRRKRGIMFAVFSAILILLLLNRLFGVEILW